MEEQDKDRYSRSRYGTGASTSSQSNSGKQREENRYRDSFYDNLLIPEDDPISPLGEKALKQELEDEKLDEVSAKDSSPASETGTTSSRPSVNGKSASGKPRLPFMSGNTGELSVEEINERLAKDRPRSERARKSYSRAAVEQDLADKRTGTDAASTAVAKKTSRRRGLNVVAGLVIALLLVGAGAAFAYVNSITGNLSSGIDDDLRDSLVKTDMANEPFYMLLLGTDASAERDEDEEMGGVYRSDSMMLARIDVPNKKVTLITIPRDIPVDLGEYGENKINAAYAYGGAALAVDTVSEFAGVPISHYAEINFDGFKAMVDALGGVEVNVPIYIDDEDAGGTLEAGTQVLNGEQALILCRARHAFDEYGDGDMYRAANQRMVLSAIAHKVLDADIATIARTVQAASEYVTTDLSLNDIIGLAQAMSGLNPDTDVYTASVPTTSQYVNDIWYEYPDKTTWATMMERTEAGLPPLEEAQVDPNTGVVMATTGSGEIKASNQHCSITIKNATEINGLASKIRTDLIAAGYADIEVGEANSRYSYPQTLVVYNEAKYENDAKAVLEVVGQGSLYGNEGMEYSMEGIDVLVVIGEDWKE